MIDNFSKWFSQATAYVSVQEVLTYAKMDGMCLFLNIRAHLPAYVHLPG
jgi:hypothetical protein